jgi:hypothetical protein
MMGLLPPSPSQGFPKDYFLKLTVKSNGMASQDKEP